MQVSRAGVTSRLTISICRRIELWSDDSYFMYFDKLKTSQHLFTTKARTWSSFYSKLPNMGNCSEYAKPVGPDRQNERSVGPDPETEAEFVLSTRVGRVWTFVNSKRYHTHAYFHDTRCNARTGRVGSQALVIRHKTQNYSKMSNIQWKPRMSQLNVFIDTCFWYFIIFSGCPMMIEGLWSEREIGISVQSRSLEHTYLWHSRRGCLYYQAVNNQA